MEPNLSGTETTKANLSLSVSLSQQLNNGRETSKTLFVVWKRDLHWEEDEMRASWGALSNSACYKWDPPPPPCTLTLAASGWVIFTASRNHLQPGPLWLLCAILSNRWVFPHGLFSSSPLHLPLTPSPWCSVAASVSRVLSLLSFCLIPVFFSSCQYVPFKT